MRFIQVFYFAASVLLFLQPLATPRFSHFSLGLSAGDITRNYESQQLQLAQNATLSSKQYNLSIDRSMIVSPKHPWFPQLKIQLDSYSTLETKQHGTSLTFVPHANPKIQTTHTLGLSGLYNQIDDFAFLQTNLGVQRPFGRYRLYGMLNLPLKRTYSFQSHLSRGIYTIAAGNQGTHLNASQQKKVVETILNQSVPDPNQVTTIYNAITTLQSTTQPNRTNNYSSIFRQYSDKIPSLYYDDLVAANKAGIYDYIAQYGLHVKIVHNAIVQTPILSTTPFLSLSLYQRQSIANIGLDITDLTGSLKTISPRIQLHHQDDRFRLRGSLSMRWFFGQVSKKNFISPHELSADTSHINYVTNTFSATNIS